MAKIKYGVEWADDLNELTIELSAFRCLLQPLNLTEKDTLRREQLLEYGKTTAAFHFKRFSKVLFPKYVWHPWADDMVEEACQCAYFGVAGCSHIGKSQFAAIWALGNYMAAPGRTLVLVTSTNVRDAKKRVWGAVQSYYTDQFFPGKMISAPTPALIYLDRENKPRDDRGVYLIPSDAKKAGGDASKILGMKAPRLFLVADELSELSEALIKTALSNLSNNDYFHFTGFSNPNSYYDPFGTFVEPKHGWNSITVDTGRWETKLGGSCIHFDSLKSPNWLLGENKWPIIKVEKIAKAMSDLGEKSPEFWRMYRGFWPPTGVVNLIFTSQDIEQFGGSSPAIWTEDKVRIAGLDPSFTQGGDRTALALGWYGKTTDGVTTVEFDTMHQLNEDVTNKSETRDFQIARQVIKICESEGVKPEHFAMDATGSGLTFSRVMEQLWSKKIYRVMFGGAASDILVPSRDSKKAREVYGNRVTEIWFAGLEYLRAGQLKGLTPELARELTSRKYEYGDGTGAKLLVESKSDMKSRGSPSPDMADAFLIMLALCRERLGVSLKTIEAPGTTVGNRSRLVKKYASIYSSNYT